jgi:hypothetical protein
MKHILYILITLFVYSCQCKHCQDNLSEVNKTIPYKYGDIVIFKNDTLGIVYDTVLVYIGEVSTKPYACSGSHDEHSYYCSATTELKYSNFLKLFIFQAPNEGNNMIGYLDGYNFFNIKNETIIYNQKPTKVFCFYSNVDTVGSEIWNYTMSKDSTFAYNNYDTVIKLIQYTTVYKDGTRRIWRLKE